MNLKRRLLLTSLALIAVMLTLTLSASMLMKEMEQTVTTVTEEYTESQQVDIAGDHLTTAHALLNVPPRWLPEAESELESAVAIMASFIHDQDEVSSTNPQHNVKDTAQGQTALDNIQRAITILQTTDHDDTKSASAEAMQSIDQARKQLTSLATITNHLVTESLDRAHRDVAIASTTLLMLCGLGCILTFAFAVAHYCWFVTPIQRLRDRVRQTVGQNTTIQADVAPSPDPLGDLNADFADLIGELDELYSTLEDRVAIKSRELVQSERLASVGYLAAGVAHEINNPLNTILGYCELTLRSLEQPAFSSVAKEAIPAMNIIRDETFRCRQIVEKLLSLVRGSDAPRESVDMAKVIREVTSMLDKLKQFRGCNIELHLCDHDEMMIFARESEMKQVILNLLVNAAEAIEEGENRVTIIGKQINHSVTIEVCDTGRGMSRETLEHVFEPFFTQKRAHGESGTGLGLSIVHAIIHDHGGTLIATSEGLGCGSCFTLNLPHHTHGENDGQA